MTSDLHPHRDKPGSAWAGDMALMLVESLRDPVYVVDRDFRVVFANDAFVRHMRAPRDHLVGASLWAHIPASQRGRLEGAYRGVMETATAEVLVQQSVVYPDRTVEVRLFPMFDGVAVMFRDITRRVTAERALATSEDHLRRALLGAQMGDFAWDAENDRMTFSQRALALYGLGPEAQGMRRDELRGTLIHPDDLPEVRRSAAVAHEEQGQYDVEYRVRCENGWRWMRAMGGPHVVDGRLLGMHGLVQDIHERKLGEARLQAEVEERERAQQRQLLLIHELNHRVKNILAMVQAIAAQTLSTAASPEAARRALDERLAALAGAHDILTRESWDGAELHDIIAGSLAPHETSPGTRVRANGPPVRLEPKQAVTLAMVLNELATNAVKYGALSVDGGWVSLAWTASAASDGLSLRLTWAEHGGPLVSPPASTGFGARLITRSLAGEQGSAELIYSPEGLCCEMALVASGPGRELQVP